MDKLQRLTNGLLAMSPNKDTITASHEGSLPITKLLSDKAKEALIYSKLTNESLLSIGQLCDDDSLAIFSIRYLHIIKTKK